MGPNDTARKVYDLAVLTPAQIVAVYPLVRHHVDHVDLETWRAFALPLIDGFAADVRPSTGIVVATRNGAARGMFVYMRLPHLGLGRALLVPHAFCAELLRTAPLWTLLLNEMVAIAGELECAMIRLVAHPPWTELPKAIRQVNNSYIPIELLLTEMPHDRL